nr:hypothetical protein [candidate division Zixibacteria bacterium]
MSLITGLRHGVIYSLFLGFIAMTLSTRNSLADNGRLSGSYEATYKALMEMKPDKYNGASVSDFIINQPDLQIILEEGSLFLCEPINERVCGAFFSGSGRILFNPPDKMEKMQLQRFYEQDTLNRAFSDMFLLFCDSTARKLKSQLEFTYLEVPGKARGVIKECLKYMGEDKGLEFDWQIIKPLLDGTENGLFYAYFDGEDDGVPFFYMNDPTDDEEICLMRKSPVRFSKNREPICKYDAGETQLISYHIDKCSLVCDFGSNFDFSASARLFFKAGFAGQKWLYFYLYSDLEVDSVFGGDGRPLDFFKGEENPILWVEYPAILDSTRVDSVTIFYHGELIDRSTNWLILKSSIGWYPSNPDIRERSIFDITYNYHKDHTVVSVGDKISEKTEKKVTTSRYVTSKPIRNASFNIGFFKEYKIEHDDILPVSVYISEMGHQELKEYYLSLGLLSGKDMEKQVGGDVATSLAFYQAVLDASPVDHFDATELSDLGGEAFPGLIHLSLFNFQRTDRMGYAKMLRAHEVAHQWWGIGVDYESYRDKWLSEGFAEYFSLWYLQLVYKDNKLFFDHLKETRREIINEHKRKIDDDRFAGPIGLGTRASSSERPDGYNLMCYDKGAWVLHMLRNMLIDLKTMNEDVFMGLLRDFYHTYEGKAATVDDFRVIAEKHAGENLDWFFNQWIYDIHIPKYNFSYKVDEVEDDGGKKYLVSCRVRQENVPDDFIMYVPLFIDFGEGRTARVRYMITGPTMDFALPPLPLKPKKIVFNDLESVLCEVDNEKWKD